MTTNSMFPHSYTLVADGACSGNPGPGGYAFELHKGDPSSIGASTASLVAFGGDLSVDTTNNIMELQGLIEGLKAVSAALDQDLVKTPCTLFLYLDSTYALTGLTEWAPAWKARGWTKKGGSISNLDLWKEALNLHDDLNSKGITFKASWVKGHSNQPMNDRVDAAAVGYRDAAIRMRNEQQAKPDAAPMMAAFQMGLLPMETPTDMPAEASGIENAPTANNAPTIQEVILVSSSDRTFFLNKIMEHLAEGWRLHGGPFSHAETPQVSLLVQAMIR